MAETPALSQALDRLDAAIKSLESAIARQQERTRSAAALEADMQRLALDRSDLAQSLDAAMSRSAELERVNRDVSHRLVAAMESVRAVLDRQGDR